VIEAGVEASPEAGARSQAEAAVSKLEEDVAASSGEATALTIENASVFISVHRLDCVHSCRNPFRHFFLPIGTTSNKNF
jgi:hypothetical protein